MRFTKNDFTLRSNTPNIRSLVGIYKVPRGQAIALNENQGFNLFLTTKQTVELDAEALRTSTTVVLTHTLANTNLTLDGRRAIAFLDGVRTPITDVDYTNNTVDVTVTDAAGTLDIFYMFTNGSIEICAIAPGTTRIEKNIYNSDFEYLHSINQYAGDSMPRLLSKMLLTQDFSLGIYVTSPAIVNWEQVNSIINIEYQVQPMEVLVQAFKKHGVMTQEDMMRTIISDWTLS